MREIMLPVSCYRGGWHDMIVAKQQTGISKEGRLINEKNNLNDLMSYVDVHIYCCFRWRNDGSRFS